MEKGRPSVLYHSAMIVVVLIMENEPHTMLNNKNQVFLLFDSDAKCIAAFLRHQPNFFVLNDYGSACFLAKCTTGQINA